jgi:hypothetical protein
MIVSIMDYYDGGTMIGSYDAALLGGYAGATMRVTKRI